MASNFLTMGRKRFTAKCASVLMFVCLSSNTIAAEADTSPVSYPAEIAATTPSYSLLGQVTFSAKSAKLTTSSKRLLAGYITKLQSAHKVQIKSYYAKSNEKSTLMTSRSTAIMMFFISRGFVPTFSVVKGTASVRKSQIFWIPKESSGQANFNTASTQATTWTVPTDARCLYFVVAGAKGGTGGSADPGYGALVSFVRRAVPGESFNLYVGGVGGSISFYSADGGIGGINGGATGGALTDSDGIGAGGGGGGWSGVFQNSTPVAIAGGGGGSASSSDFHSGAGGDADIAGRNGATMWDESAGGPGGQPGTLNSAGVGGTLMPSTNASAGQPGIGRVGGSGASSIYRGGGGGGGGYFGGGGGAYSGTDSGTSGGGGGGSNFVPTGGVTFVAPLANDGSISIKYSNWSMGTCRV